MNGIYQEPGPIQLKPFADKTGLLAMPDFVEAVADFSPDGNFHETIISYQTLWNAQLSGVKPILKGHDWDDYAYITVSYIFEEVEYTVGGFAVALSFDDMKQDQEWFEVNYSAFIPAGFFINFHYWTVKQDGDPIKVKMNMKLHKVTA
jgi:hypothetical protein